MFTWYEDAVRELGKHLIAYASHACEGDLVVSIEKEVEREVVSVETVTSWEAV